MSTFSFLNTLCSITGPGGSINLGAGAAVADEGITLEPNDDINVMTVGADGAVMHSLGANKSRTITVRLLKTSPTNQKLAAMYAFQTASAANHGQNTISLANNQTQDMITCQQVAFKRGVPLTYAKDGGICEWQFDGGIVDVTLGGNV
jgi:hypothetical protein